MFKQALSARHSVIDRSVVAQKAERRNGAKAQSDDDPNSSAESVRLPVRETPAKSALVLVPEVSGRAVRGAVYAVHQRGLRARIEGSGRIVVRTLPAAGDSLALGKTVVLYVSPSRNP
jgi:hypothetical protein